MRTLTQITLQLDRRGTVASEDVRAWLETCGYRPETVNLPEDIRGALLESDVIPTETAPLFVRKAVEIFVSVPRFEQERFQALETAKLLIRFNDPVHATTVWGIVCIDTPNVTVRWRHQVSRSLEHATEDLVRNVWSNSGSHNLFEPFPDRQNVPVREPRSTTDAYVGEILPPANRMRERARTDKKADIKLALGAAIATVVFTLIGWYLFKTSVPEVTRRWLSGAFDRLATTAAATAVVSYLSYLFHLHALQRKHVIDWK